MPTDTILNDEQVRKIEGRLKTWTSDGQYPASWDEVNALCATVRVLRSMVYIGEHEFPDLTLEVSLR